MHDQGIVHRTALGLEDPRHGGPVLRVGRQPIYRFGRDRHQLPRPEQLRGTVQIGRAVQMCIRDRQSPCAFVTVLPGQLPVCWFMPVSSLKTVLFPTLGLPARAITLPPGAL